MQPICNQVFHRQGLAESELYKISATNARISNSLCKAVMTTLILLFVHSWHYHQHGFEALEQTYGLPNIKPQKQRIIV